MASAFQSDAFQVNAFQIEAGAGQRIVSATLRGSSRLGAAMSGSEMVISRKSGSPRVTVKTGST